MKSAKVKKLALNSIVSALFVIAALLSCEKDNTGEGPLQPEENTGIRRTFERGPVRVRIDVDQKEISIADRLNLLITVTAHEDYEVELPRFGEKLEQFGIVDYHTAQPQLVENDERRVSRSYVLEPFLSGEYTIPPMRVLFWKKGGKEKDLHEVETDAIVIVVTSLLPENKANLKLNDISPPVQLPRSPSTGLWLGVGLGILCAGAIAGAVIWRARKGGQDIPGQGVPPHETALKALEALVAEDLIEKGDVKHFYQRISNILRHYIENRFGLRAPEQTSEEFLSDLAGGDRLSDRHRALLETFLTHCDLVKFAEHQPATRDIQKTFDYCKGFITDTTGPAESTAGRVNEPGQEVH